MAHAEMDPTGPEAEAGMLSRGKASLRQRSPEEVPPPRASVRTAGLSQLLELRRKCPTTSEKSWTSMCLDFCLPRLCSRAQYTQNLSRRLAEERRRAQEDAKQSGIWGILNSSTGALMGATCAGGILWLQLFEKEALLLFPPPGPPWKSFFSSLFVNLSIQSCSKVLLPRRCVQLPAGIVGDSFQSLAFILLLL